jgi:O-acetyl-ADP-ribose deacetylase (regulator of RNase III)
MLLQDSLNADKAADERTLFKNRQSTMLSRSRKGGAAAGEGQRTQQAITLLKRYTLVEGGTGGQGCELQICRGDLTKVGTEALVTPASPDLSSGGMGVNSRVHSAAGAVFSRLVARVPEVSPGLRCDTGSAVATPSGELAVAKVIHAVAPVHPKAPLWHEMVYSGKHARHSDPPLGVPRNYRNYEDYQVPGLLAGAHSAAMALVNKHGLSTFSIPALSCDVGGYPPVEAAEIALKAVLDRTNVGGSESAHSPALSFILWPFVPTSFFLTQMHLSRMDGWRLQLS